ncbi:MAG: AMP-dependent synthetase [Desulfuromonas sp.]|nr:MAG: AMP-dependent synthetase [Desulfuromonas sp.]
MSTIVELIQSSCLKHPYQVALREKKNKHWHTTSYADLWRDSDAVAAGLEQLGIKKGCHIALLAPSSTCWITTYLGVLKFGCVAVTVDKELKQNELRHVLIDSEAQIIFTNEDYVEDLLELRKNLPDVQHIVVMEKTSTRRSQAAETFSIIGDLITEWHSLVTTLNIPREQAEKLERLANQAHQLLTSATADPLSNEPPNLFSPAANLIKEALKKGILLDFDQFIKKSTIEPVEISPDDTAVILYTSGTTGRSKGAILSHGNITSNIKDLVPHFQLDQRIHTLSFLPINHVFEQVCGILLPLSLGGTISFAQSLKKLGENLTEVKPTFLLGVPAVYRIFLDRIMKGINSKRVSKALYSLPLTRTVVAKKVKETLGAGTIFVSGGAALDPAVAAQFKELDIRIYQGYGITETSPVITAEQPGRMRLGTVGKPLPSVQVKILAPNDEGVGEIICKGPNVMKGYYKNQEATDEVLTDGWYHTGDMGKIDADGYLTICGRVKNLIVTPNGKNVYPEEIENELLNSPYIQEVMVYGHKVSPTAEEVHAQIYPDQEMIDSYAQENGSYPLEHKAVENLIRSEVLRIGKELADYKRVKRFTLREDEFPKTTTRKIKRFVVEADISASE